MFILYNVFELFIAHINGLVQERHNSRALAMELCLSCSNPLIYDFVLDFRSFQILATI